MSLVGYLMIIKYLNFHPELIIINTLRNLKYNYFSNENMKNIKDNFYSVQYIKLPLFNYVYNHKSMNAKLTAQRLNK